MFEKPFVAIRQLFCRHDYVDIGHTVANGETLRQVIHIRWCPYCEKLKFIHGPLEKRHA